MDTGYNMDKPLKHNAKWKNNSIHNSIKRIKYFILNLEKKVPYTGKPQTVLR